MSGELTREQLDRVKAVNGWRTTDAELRATVAAVLAGEEVGSVAELCRDRPEAFDALYDLGRQLAGDRLTISRIDGATS